MGAAMLRALWVQELWGQDASAPGGEQGGHEEFGGVRLIVLAAQKELELGHGPVAAHFPPHKAAQQRPSRRRRQPRHLLRLPDIRLTNMHGAACMQGYPRHVRSCLNWFLGMQAHVCRPCNKQLC